ncbi:MAG: acetolactate synthase small subunit [Rickettsiales bacterium]|nr:acetolactate synthase small subunit [Rickettsiales bacterium]
MNAEHLDIVYDIIDAKPEEERHILSVLVDNEFGVLNRVVGLFSARGYNIEALTVAEVDGKKNYSRITVVTTGSPQTVVQIMNLLERMVPVHKVNDLTTEGPHVERELALVKVAGKDDERVEALRIADIFRARSVDATIESFIFEITGKSSKIDSFIDLMQPIGLVEVARTGATAMSRGKKGV